MILLLVLVCISVQARTLSGSLEFRIRSNLSDITSFGTLADNLDYAGKNYFESGGNHGAITQLYRADRLVGTASTDVMGLVGSLTNSIGETVTFSIVKGIYLQEVSGLGTLTVSGIATASIPPYGSFAIAGPITVASVSDSISVSTTAPTTYRVWIVGD